jgi:diguanylate cyclase (GGDEF)-like protein
MQKVIETGLIIGLANHTTLISKDGTERSIADSAAPIKDKDGTTQGVILVFRDITEEKHRQDQIYYMSYYDSLTGLYNRRFFEEEIKKIDTERNLPISIIMGDVNGLKLTNDAFGHSEGDKLLKKAAEAIKGACRADDVAARWGGDEFTILLPKTKKEEAEAIVKRIKSTCSEVKSDSINVSISFGCDTKESIDTNILKVLKGAEDYMYKHKVIESNSMRGNIINTILNTLHEKNPREEMHSKRVSELCQQIGTAMELPEMEINKLKASGLLHDIGKVAIEERVLNKSELLTEQEWIEVRRHPDIGYRILSSSSEMVELAQCILYHHERFDGSGYPRGLKQEEIPLLSRIINVADSYDAMTSERAYKKVLNKSIAIEELVKNKGTQFDPYIVDIFIGKVLNNI